ncbi:MAG TPA: nucleotidyl transferase AbiEii/AbiGii toxin family protein [Calditerricola sp.]
MNLPVPYSTRLFWDVPEEAIDGEFHADWIIARVLERGTVQELASCIRYYGWPRIKHVALGKQGLAPHIQAFWQWYVDSAKERGVMHTEILPPGGQDLLKRLCPFLPAGAMLCGGTAVALHLGHRRSEDFDFLTEQAFDAAALATHLQDEFADATVDDLATNTLHTTIGGLKMSFIRQRGVRLVPGNELNGVPIAGLDTLLALKLNAIAGRGSRKDFIDLYAICIHEGLGVSDLLQHAQQWAPGINTGHLLRSLAYFEDAEREPMPAMLAQWRWNEVRRFFESGVRRTIDRMR